MESTKESIVRVATEMFAKRGFEAVSIRDICREVGIKESTVYYHFKNKKAILDEQAADILSIERLHDSEADSQYRRIFFELPRQQVERVFCQMSEKQIIRPCDASALASLYYGTIYTAWCSRKNEDPVATEKNVSDAICLLFQLIRVELNHVRKNGRCDSGQTAWQCSPKTQKYSLSD